MASISKTIIKTPLLLNSVMKPVKSLYFYILITMKYYQHAFLT